MSEQNVISIDAGAKCAPATPAAKDWAIASEAFAEISDKSKDQDIKELVTKHIDALIIAHGMTNYEVLLLVDEHDDISPWHANRIYRGANAMASKKDIFLVVHSRGGNVEPAYLISKTCKRLTKNKFVVAIPRKAKSAATLIALGADEIHMGLMSELGPIDPQFGGLPALGLQNALAMLADLSCRYPGASEMLGKFLSEKLNLGILGYFDRVTESSVQYAERLLEGKKLPRERSPQQLGEHFVKHYKDHGFVIDADEAEKLLGRDVVKQSTPEYKFSNVLYESLDYLELLTTLLLKKKFDFVGTVSSGFRLFEPTK